MTIVIHNAAIVTVDDADSVHYNAAIAIEGDRIAAIGPSAEVLAQYPTAEKIDGTGKLVMPFGPKGIKVISHRLIYRRADRHDPFIMSFIEWITKKLATDSAPNRHSLSSKNAAPN